MQVTKQYVKALILEELTKSDVRDVVESEIQKQLKKEIPKVVKKELEKMLKKDLSFHHPYIIDRIKV